MVVDSVSSLLESQEGSELLHVIDEYRFSLTSSATTPEKHVLFTPGALAEHQAHDVWWEARETIYGLSRAAFGITSTPPAPACPRTTARALDP